MKPRDLLDQGQTQAGALGVAGEAIERCEDFLPLGLGHAVWCAREIVGDEPFAVLLPDMLSRGCMQQMLSAYERHGGNVIAVEEVKPEETHQYGIVGVGQTFGQTFEINGMVEKPKAGTAPSTTPSSAAAQALPWTTVAAPRARAAGPIRATLNPGPMSSSSSTAKWTPRRFSRLRTSLRCRPAVIRSPSSRAKSTSSSARRGPSPNQSATSSGLDTTRTPLPS